MGYFAAYDMDGNYQPQLSGTNAQYYSAILLAALGTKIRAIDNPTANMPGGTLAVLRPDAADVLERMVEVESRYYFRWISYGTATSIDDFGGGIPQFARVDVAMLALLDGLSLAKAFDGQPWLFGAPELKQVRGTFTIQQRYLVASGELALYIDVNPETESYKHRCLSDGTYQRVRTWKPKIVESLVDTPEQCEYFYHETSDRNAPDEGDSRLNLRELKYLYFECKRRLKVKQSLGGFRKVFEGKSLATIRGTLQDALKSLPSASQGAARQAAEDAAQIVPIGFTCLYYGYYDGQQELQGFISDLPVSAVTKRGGNYEMRADPASETRHCWQITEKDQDLFTWATLVGRACRLGHNLADASPPLAYQPTNTPYITPDGASAVSGLRLITYYKDKSPSRARRNLPQDPRPPRLVRATYKDRVSPNLALLKWKKGMEMRGERWWPGERSARDQAGSVMAAALSKSGFYSDALDSSDGKITATQLPATAFAKYVIVNDPQAAQAWKELGKPLKDVRTDQEWCHLFGHGDGGTEIVENFVSGSKHCNTEQLAIEIGQRRVTRNGRIRPDDLKKFTWRVTAHLLSNGGTYFATTLNPSQIINKCFRPGRLSKEEKTLLEKALKDKDPGEVLEYLAREIRTANDEWKNMLLELQHWYQVSCFTPYPLAKAIHYRIFYDNKKCFEHYFDAQSESFDVHEARILDYTVERELYRALQEAGVTVDGQSAWDYYLASLEDRANRFGPPADVGQPQQQAGSERATTFGTNRPRKTGRYE